MTETTEASSVLDIEAIRLEARHVPKFTEDQADEAAAYAERLRGYVEQLLAVVDALPQPVGSEAESQRKARTSLTEWARDTLEYGRPDDPFYTENLAVHCRTLASIAVKAVDRVEYCCWCKAFRTGTRVIRTVEIGSGPVPALSACAECCETHGLTPLSDRPVAV